MEVILKSELTQPFAVSTAPDSFGYIFSNIYPFADAGSVGSQPANIPDLIGNHDIAMNYHADPTKSGGINAGGNLELGNHGNGQVNTWGTFNVPVNWNTSLTANSRIYLIEFIYKYSSARQFLISGHFHVEFKTSTTMTVMIENQAAHGIRYYNKTHNFVDGQRVCIAIQMNKSDNSYAMVINGVDVTSELYANGNPFTGNISNQTPLDWLLLGRWSSWDNYYGFEGDINLLAFGTDFNGSELSVAQMIELTNNPYQILQQEQALTGIEQTVDVAPIEQLTQSQLIDVASFNIINAIVCEQVAQVQPVDLTLNNQAQTIVAEQKTEQYLSAIAIINNVKAITSEQLTQSTTGDNNTTQLVSAIQTQQVTNSLLVTVTSDGSQAINVVVSEQVTQSTTVELSELASIQAVIAEQLTDSVTQNIQLTIITDAIILEQLTQTELIAIVEHNVAEQLNIDIDQITIEMLTPTYSIESLTPIYTIEHLH